MPSSVAEPLSAAATVSAWRELPGLPATSVRSPSLPAAMTGRTPLGGERVDLEVVRVVGGGVAGAQRHRDDVDLVPWVRAWPTQSSASPVRLVEPP